MGENNKIENRCFKNSFFKLIMSDNFKQTRSPRSVMDSIQDFESYGMGSNPIGGIFCFFFLKIAFLFK